MGILKSILEYKGINLINQLLALPLFSMLMQMMKVGLIMTKMETKDHLVGENLM